MAIPTLVAANGAGFGGGSGTTTAINTTGATALRVFLVTQSAGLPSSAFTDSAGNTWAIDAGPTQFNTPFTANLYVFKATGTINVSASHTFTCNFAAATPSGQVGSIWPVALKPTVTGPLSITTAVINTDATSPYTSSSVTPSANDALLISFGATDGSGSPITITWANSFTTVSGTPVTDQNSFWGGAVASLGVNSAGSYASQFTDNSTTPSDSVLALISITEAVLSTTGNIAWIRA